MKKAFITMGIIVTLLLLLVSYTSHAADIRLKWNPVETATSYKVFISLDTGVTWGSGIDAGGATEHVIIDLPEDALILFKVGAYNEYGANICHWAGAWYDHRRRPPDPVWGLGIMGLP